MNKKNHIWGRKGKNSKVYKITGNWYYGSAMFYSTSLADAWYTASNIESSLYVWSEEENKWMLIIDIYSVWEIGDESDEYGDLATQNIDFDLKKAGFDITFEELRKRRGKIIQSAYHEREYDRQSIPKGATEIAPGVFI